MLINPLKHSCRTQILAFRTARSGLIGNPGVQRGVGNDDGVNPVVEMSAKCDRKMKSMPDVIQDHQTEPDN